MLTDSKLRFRATRFLTSNGLLLVTALLIVDSLHFALARLLLPYISPGVSAMYVLAIGTVEVALFGLTRKRLRFNTLGKRLWFFLAIGFLVAASTNINYEAVALIDPGTASLLHRPRSFLAWCLASSGCAKSSPWPNCAVR